MKSLLQVTRPSIEGVAQRRLSSKISRVAKSPVASGLGSLLCLSLTAIPVYAQQAPASASDAAEVVVTASRLSQTPTGLAQSVTVIDQAQIRESNPARVQELLSRVPGVYVDQVGRTGGFSSIYIRGAEESHVLIMVDGVKMNDPTTTRGSAYDLTSIDVSQIERIEVLRGPASAVHGGEALAGVVNIITKRQSQAGTSGSAYLGFGQSGFRRYGGSIAAGNEAWQGRFSVGQTEDGSGRDDASLKLNSYSGSLRFTPNRTLSGEIFANRIERKSSAFPDDSGGPRLAVNRALTFRESTDSVYGARFGTGDAQALRLQASATVFDRQERSDNAAIDGGVRFPVPSFINNTDFRRTTLNLTGTRSWGSLASVVVGIERQSEKGSLASVGDFFGAGSNQNLDFDLKRNTNSLFAEGRFQVAPTVGVQVGLRRDKIDGIDAETTPHLGVVWDVSKDTTVKANYSAGFKPPSFFALGFPIGGNPDLKPESSKNAEIAVSHRLDAKGSSVNVNLFSIDYKNLVDFDSNTFTNINRGAINVKGIEPSLRYQIDPRWRVQGGFTVLSITEKDGLPPLRKRPKHRANIATVYDLDDMSSIFGVLNYTGSYLDRSNPTGEVTIPSFYTIDLSYSQRINKTFRAAISVENLLNKSYEQFIGFAARDRRLRLDLRAEF